jgi:HK97 family phage major capsid protein
MINKNPILGYRKNGAPIYGIKGGAPTLKELLEQQKGFRSTILTLDPKLEDGTASKEELADYDGAINGLDGLVKPIEDATAYEGRRSAALAAARAALESDDGNDEGDGDGGNTGRRSGGLVIEPGRSITGGSQTSSKRKGKDAYDGADLVALRSGSFGTMVAREGLQGFASRAATLIETTRGLDDEGRNSAMTLLDSYRLTHSDEGISNLARHMLLTGHPEYMDAFREYANDPGGVGMRAVLSLTQAQGGYLLPFVLDPTIVLTNAGSANPFRQIARQESTTSNAWQGVTSGGVNAEWIGEAAVMSEAAPGTGQIQITPAKADAVITGSWEVLADTNFASQLPMLISDAKDRLEATAFATGSGTGQPWGVITRTTSVTTSRVAPSTGGAFAAATEVYNTIGALNPRFRNSRTKFLANFAVLNKIRSFDVYGGSSFWVDLSGPIPPKLTGFEIFESSAMVAAITTGSNVLLAGDFSEYIIVDRVGVSVLYDNNVKDGATQRPTGQGQWVAFWRTGGDVAVYDAFRILKL